MDLKTRSVLFADIPNSAAYLARLWSDQDHCDGRAETRSGASGQNPYGCIGLRAGSQNEKARGASSALFPNCPKLYQLGLVTEQRLTVKQFD